MFDAKIFFGKKRVICDQSRFIFPISFVLRHYLSQFFFPCDFFFNLPSFTPPVRVTVVK